MKLEMIIDSPKCYGCGACVNICAYDALHMQYDVRGFAYPQFSADKCINCNKCFSVCPAVEEHTKKLLQNQRPNCVYSARIKDDKIRKSSSSGGMFYVLSSYFLSNEGYVCGVVWNDDFSVKHICSKEASDRDEMMQSKYIQSDTLFVFGEVKQHLLDGDDVLFTGTPCQCAGLRLFLGRINTDNLMVVDVLCGGNVSPGFFKEYIRYIEKEKNDSACSVCFRTKKLGWKQHHIAVKLKHSLYERARRDDEPFFSLYLGKQIIRDSCFQCGFVSKERVSDITLGDFWGIDDLTVDDDVGISFVKINTDKGQKFIDAVREDVRLEERDIDIAIKHQINLRCAPIKPANRDDFWNDWREKGSEYVLRKYTVFGKTNYIKRKLIRIIRGIMHKRTRC
ncbi:MAG: 4Fe-4S dicluster domain-containing protein [Lachnospiraceae bacterium]|nr:4Fe-4S dicluster domain-containing protein [Lachnospiraceae bacterium]